MAKNCNENSQIADKGDQGADQAHRGALCDTDPIKDAQKGQDSDCNPESVRPQGWEDDAEIEDARETAQSCRQEVVHENKHPAQGAEPGIESMGCHTDNTTALGEACRDLSVLEREQYEDNHREED